MNVAAYRFLIIPGLISATFFIASIVTATAQIPVSNRVEDRQLKHGIEQYHQGHYQLASQSLTTYLSRKKLPVEDDHQDVALLPSLQEARYYLVLSQLKSGAPDAVLKTRTYIDQTVNPVYGQRAAFALAQHYFRQNALEEAIEYYETAGISNLSNQEIADAKFELAYSYFNERRFDQAKPLFAAIKEMPENKYYSAGNYYYGLLAYNDRNYRDALASFERIHHEEAYKDIVPYYEAEIHYFLGNSEKVMQLSARYLKKKEPFLFYHKEMQLLTGQTLFEQKKFAEALPYFEYYYEHTDKIRKEELYELAYCYYRLEKWNKAIERFQPLSNTEDSLGQTSMYLLGDCYLKAGDKKGAMNAFGLCADMDHNPSQKEAASFLYAKLSYELGNDGIATARFYDFVREYPNSSFGTEAKTLLSGLLAKSSNYSKAFGIMNDMAVKDKDTWGIYQQVAVGYAMQLMQDGQLHAADSVLSLSLQQPEDKAYEAISYFWKSEIAYREKNQAVAVQFSRSFLNKVKGIENQVRSISQQATVQHAHIIMGYAQLESDNYDDATEAFGAAQQYKNSGGGDDAMTADVLLREADALFMKKDFNKAAVLYDKAIASGSTQPDYARYQKSLILGLQGKVAEKNRLLQELVQKRPESAYKNEAQYELAVSYLESGEKMQAIPLLKALAEGASNTEPVKAKSLLKLAYAYQENDEDGNAVSTYQQFITTYPSSTDRAVATDALRNLYISMGKPEQYAAFLEEHNMPADDQAGLDQTYYAAAETEYANNKWDKAVLGFDKYLDEFPNGRHTTKAHYYRAESYAKLNATEKALKDYDAVVASGWSDFAEDAASKAAHLSVEKKDYTAARKYFSLLRNVTMDNTGLQHAYMGLLKASFADGAYDEARSYADTLLSLPELGSKINSEAQLYKARSLQQSNRMEEAMVIYKTLDKKGSDSYNAEARYRIAEILWTQKKLKEAETQASYAVQSSGSQDYWVVKSYMLLADILAEQKDYFNAKATLQSIIKNASDPTLKDEASKKLSAVKAMEKKKSKLSEE